jgi:hypothetical protein
MRHAHVGMCAYTTCAHRTHTHTHACWNVRIHNMCSQNTHIHAHVGMCAYTTCAHRTHTHTHACWNVCIHNMCTQNTHTYTHVHTQIPNAHTPTHIDTHTHTNTKRTHTDTRTHTHTCLMVLEHSSTVPGRLLFLLLVAPDAGGLVGRASEDDGV